MDVISTYPSVIYEVTKTNGEDLLVDNPTFLPDPSVIEEIREPTVRLYVMTPNEYIGDMMRLMMEKRGTLEQAHGTFHDRRHRCGASRGQKVRCREYNTLDKHLLIW